MYQHWGPVKLWWVAEFMRNLVNWAEVGRQSSTFSCVFFKAPFRLSYFSLSHCLVPRNWVGIMKEITKRTLCGDTSLGKTQECIIWFCFTLREARCLCSTDAGSMGLDAPRTQTVIITSFPSNSWKFTQQVFDFMFHCYLAGSLVFLLVIKSNLQQIFKGTRKITALGP